MSEISFFLAQIDVTETLVPNLQKTGAARSGLTFLFGAFGILTLLILGWAIFIRKRPAESSRRYSYPSGDSRTKSRDNLSQSGAETNGRKRRRRKRRSRNPTLAETGGLPPIRPEGYFEDPP
jgi:hypothetical protein